MTATAILTFQNCISDVIDMFQIEVPLFSQIVVTIGHKWRNGSSFSKSKMAAAAILKSTLAVEPPSQVMNSLFAIFNQKFSFNWGILTFKGSLLSGALK